MVPGGQMQYFVLPLEFKSEEEQVRIDFTFRSGFTADSLVTANFSVYTDKSFSDVKQVILHHANGETELINVNKLFSEPFGNSIQSRYTSKLYFSDFLPFLSHPEQSTIEIAKDDNSFIVHATRKTQKKLSQLKSQVGVLQ